MANAPALHGEGAQSATVDQGEDLDHEVSVAVKVGVELGGNRGDGGEDGEGDEGDEGDEGIVGKQTMITEVSGAESRRASRPPARPPV